MNPSFSPLLNLPAELRNIIYHHVIASDSTPWPLYEPAYIRAGDACIRYGPWRPNLRAARIEDEQIALRKVNAERATRHLAILAVSRSIYFEARTLPFEKYTFEFNSARLYPFADSLTPWQKRAITALKLEFRVIKDNEIFLGGKKLYMQQFRDAIALFPRLRKITIGFFASRLCIATMRDREKKRTGFADAARRLETVVQDVLGEVVEWEVLRAEWETQAERDWPSKRRDSFDVGGEYLVELW